MTDDSSTPTGDPTGDPAGGTPEDPVGTSNRARAVAIGIGAVAAIAVIVLLVFLVVRSDDDGTITDDTTTTVADTTTTVTDTTTTGPETTTTVADVGPTPEELAVTVWPPAESDLRYTDPLEATEGFVVEFLGMTDPLIGEFVGGDARSGEVEVRSIETFTPTIVILRTFGTDGTWWVLGAASPDIVVDEPASGVTVTSPLRLTGRSVTFEANVEVAIRIDGEDDAVFEGFVTGGAAPGDPAPFDETIEWDAPESGRGVIVFSERSSDDGRLLQATTVRVEFGED